MSYNFSVTLRGVEYDVEVTSDSGYEHDTSSHDLEWNFVGVFDEELKVLAFTDAEEQIVWDAAYAASANRGEDADHYDERP